MNWYPQSMRPQGPAAAPTAPIYRAGNAGLESDISGRNSFLNTAFQSYLNNQNQSFNNQNQWNAGINNASGMVTAGQIGAAKGDLAGSRSRFETQADQGDWTPQQEQEQLVQQAQMLQRAGRGAQMAFNASASQRGLGANPGAIAALGNQSMWEAAAQKGLLENQIQTQEAGARERGLQGLTGINQLMAQMDMAPTQENALAFMHNMQGGGAQAQQPDLNSIYNNWRNSAIGPDSWDWNKVKAPVAPSYNTATPGYVAPVQTKPDWNRPITWGGYR